MLCAMKFGLKLSFYVWDLYTRIIGQISGAVFDSDFTILD